jgi:hypothetical protein
VRERTDISGAVGRPAVARADRRIVFLSEKDIVLELVEALDSEDITLIVGSGVSLSFPARSGAWCVASSQDEANIT